MRVSSSLPRTLARQVTQHQETKLYSHRPAKRVRRTPLRTCALHIDRKAHLDRAWLQQKVAEEASQAQRLSSRKIGTVEVATLAELDYEIESAGSSVVVVAFYSRSCGACKEMLQRYRELCKEAVDQRAGVRFLTHNVRDEFDDVTHIARLYRIKTVPCFAFLSEGAMMRSLPMPDTRLDPSSIRKLIGRQTGSLNAALREMLFRNTPSARR